MMGRKPASHPRPGGEVAKLSAHRGGTPRPAAGRPADLAEQRSRRKSGPVRCPLGQDRPSPGVHPYLATPITLPVPDQQTPSPLVQVSLGERERLIDPHTGSPQHDDQTSHPPAVTIVSGLAHHRDDLVDRGRIARITAGFGRWYPPGVMAGHRGRRTGAAGRRPTTDDQVMAPSSGERTGLLPALAQTVPERSSANHECGCASSLPRTRPVAEATQSALLILLNGSESASRHGARSRTAGLLNLST